MSLNPTMAAAALGPQQEPQLSYMSDSNGGQQNTNAACKKHCNLLYTVHTLPALH